MGLLDTVRRWLSMRFQKDAMEEFDIEQITTQEMDFLIDRCMDIYRGRPYWLDDKNGIRTIKFGKSLCEEVARLTTLAINVTVDGSTRAEWLQKQIDGKYFKLREWLEYGCAAGSFILKPNGKGIDFLLPNNFKVVDCDDDGNITGAVFIDQYVVNSALKKKYYTKFEYHRFVDTEAGNEYQISNRAYVSTNNDEKGKPIALEDTKWAGLEEDVYIAKANGEPIERMLFGYFRTPKANDTEINSPLGLPLISDVIEELKDLDIAYSRNSEEIKNSRRIALVDDRLLMQSGEKITNKSAGSSIPGLPSYVRRVFGTDQKEFYQEINPELNTETRIKGLNNQLSFVGWKAGFSGGYFVFNEKTGMVTATQVESDDRRTIQLIKDYRDKLEDCMDGLIYALNIFADLYSLAPVGDYEITYDFGDITYNREEDRARWWQYVVQGQVPAWMYYQKFEGMSEKEAKAMVAEAQGQQEEPGLYEEE